MPILKNINESDTLVIAATGVNFKLTLPVNSFLKAAELTEKSTIIITDRSRRLALGGISPECPSLSSLVEYLRHEIARLSLKKVVMTGTSAGGYTALLLGHLLKADYVVAFAPYSYLNRAEFVRRGDPAMYSMKKILESVELLPDGVKKFFDLRQVLSGWNGVTEYYVHVSRYHKLDRDRAMYLRESPHVDLILHPYVVHSVPAALAKSGRLGKCFTFPYRRERYSLKTSLLRVGNLTSYLSHKLRGHIRRISL